MPAISVKDLTKRYGGVCLPDGLSLTVGRGEFVTLLGGSRSGKSAICRLLAGVDAPDGGEGTVLDLDLQTKRRQIKKAVGFCPSDTPCDPMLTVEEHLVFLGRLYGMGKEAARDRANRCLARFLLTDRAHTPAGELSLGERRRLGLAMATVNEPALLILDDPTGGLDALRQRELWDSLFKLRGQYTVVLATSVPMEAEILSDRVGILKDGRMLSYGTVQKLLQDTYSDHVTEAYLRTVFLAEQLEDGEEGSHRA